VSETPAPLGITVEEGAKAGVDEQAHEGYGEAGVAVGEGQQRAES
jgi:hypothetical protein